MLTIYGTEASLSQVKKRIEQLQKQLKELENE
jgi:conjugal transfer/entry exclusion protein